MLEGAQGPGPYLQSIAEVVISIDTHIKCEVMTYRIYGRQRKLLGFTGMHSSKTDIKGSITERFWPLDCIYDILKTPKLNCTFTIHRPPNSPDWYAMCHILALQYWWY